MRALRRAKPRSLSVVRKAGEQRTLNKFMKYPRMTRMINFFLFILLKPIIRLLVYIIIIIIIYIIIYIN